MKSNNLILLVFFSFMLLFSCSKNSEVASSFPFTLSETHVKETTVNIPQKTTFKVTPEKAVDSNPYSFKYEVVSGSGSYVEEDQILITPNNLLPMAGLTQTIYFVSDQPGETKIRITVADSFDRVETIDLVYNVSNNPFSATFTAEFVVTQLQRPTPVKLTVTNDGSDSSVSYDRKFTFLEGSGSIFVKGSNQEIPQEEFNDVSTGLSEYDIKFSELGEARVSVSIRDSNGSVLERILSFDVQPVEVSFLATPEFTELFAEETNNIYFELTETGGSGGSYELKYIVNSGDVSLSFNNVPVLPETFNDVNLGNFDYQVLSNTPGDASISFILINQDGVLIQKDILFTIKEHEVAFEMETVFTEAYTMQPVPIDFTIIELPWASPPYTFRFFADGISGIRYNDVEYEAGQEIEVLDDQFSIEYLGGSVGLHNATFFLTNDRGIQTSIQWQIDILEPNFEYTIFSLDNIFQYTLNGTTSASVTHVITPFGDNQFFSIKYELLTGQGFIKELDGPLGDMSENVYYDFSPGERILYYVPESAETATVRWTVISDSGIEHSNVIELFNWQ